MNANKCFHFVISFCLILSLLIPSATVSSQINPQVKANSEIDEIQAWGWPNGTQLTLTIDDPENGTGVDFSETGVIGPDPWNPGNYEAFFQLNGRFDVHAGQIITVTDGTDSKAITVAELTITNIDKNADTISGLTDPDALLIIQISTPTGYSIRRMNADPAGNWLANFSVAGSEPDEFVVDIKAGSRGFVQVNNAAGEAITWVSIRVPDPYFVARAKEDAVDAFDWPKGVTLTLTIDSDSDPDNGILFMDSRTTPTGNTNYTGFNLSGIFDVQPGQFITLTDGDTIKTHIVRNLSVTEVNSVADTVSGTADPGANVFVGWACDTYNFPGGWALADVNGIWQADFGPASANPYDLQPGFGSCDAIVGDEDGDSTNAGWYVPAQFNPTITVTPFFYTLYPFNRVNGNDWTPGTTVHLYIDDPTNGPGWDYEDYTTSPSGQDCWAGQQLCFKVDPNVFQIRPGQVVRLTDGNTIKETVVTNLNIEWVDYVTDTVGGTADPGSQVNIWVGRPNSNLGMRRVVTTGPDGNWVADYSLAGNGDGEQVFDLKPGDFFIPTQIDPDGDSTTIWWSPIVTYLEMDTTTNAAYVSGYPFGSTVTISFDDPSNGNGWDYNKSVIVPLDQGAWCQFTINIEPSVFLIAAGQLVRITDGTTTLQGTIPDVRITSVDPAADTISGIAPAGGTVNLFPFYVGPHPAGVSRNVIADTSGNWFADFADPGSGDTFDLIPGAGVFWIGYSNDEKINIRYQWPLGPAITANITDQRVETVGWPYNTNVTMSIDDPETQAFPDFIQSTMVERDFSMWEKTRAVFQGGFEIQPGFIVTVSDGTVSKSLVVSDLQVTGIDVNADTISGTAQPGSIVQVGWICNENGCARRRVTSDSNGNWLADFAHPGMDDDEQDLFDIRPGIGSEANQCDADGDCMRYGWRVFNPHIEASAIGNWVQAREWPNGTLLALTISGAGGIYTATMGQAPWNPGDPNDIVAVFDLQGYDIQPGDTLTVTGGTATKVLQVGSVAVTSIDPVADTVSGTAAAGSQLHVWACDKTQCANRNPTTDENGNWTANFFEIEPNGDRSTFDIVPGTNGGVQQYDIDADITQTDWRVPNPGFSVRANNDQVEAYEWPNDIMLTLEVDDPGTTENPDYTNTYPSIPDTKDPNFSYTPINLWGVFDIQPGYLVRMSDGTTTKTLTVTSLAFTDFDVDHDTVSGVAGPGSRVDVWACGQWSCENRHVNAGSDGNWLADFANPGVEGDEKNTFDIARGTWVDSQQGDDDGDQTMFGQNVPNPRIEASARDNWVQAREWTIGTDLTLIISGTGGNYTTTAIMGQNPWNPGDPNDILASFDLQGYDIQPGDILTVTDGTTTKVLQVSSVTITSVNPDADTVTGIAEPGSVVEVGWLKDEQGNAAFRRVTTGDDGIWEANFAVRGEDGNEQDLFNIQLGIEFNVSRTDDDGDFTSVYQVYRNQHVGISLAEHLVWCPWWPMGDLLSLEVYDSLGSLLYNPPPESVIQAFFTDEFEFPMAIFYYGNGFEMQPGYRVVVSDGFQTEETVVTGLTLTDVIMNTDQVTGTAVPGSDVYVDAWGAGIVLQTIANPAGQWEVNFSGQLDIIPTTPLSIYQSDSDSDQTYIAWPIADMRGTVLLDGEPLSGVEIWVGGSEYHRGYFGWHACTDENGRFVIPKLPPGPSDGFVSATGPAVILPCANPEFLDNNGIPLITQFWDHVNGIPLLTPFTVGTPDEPYTELQYDVIRAYGIINLGGWMHVIDNANSGACPFGEATCDLPITDGQDLPMVKGYNIHDQTFVDLWTSDPALWNYASIYDGIESWDSEWVLGSDKPFGTGNAQLRMQQAHDELVILRYIDPATGQVIVFHHLFNDSKFVDRGDGVRVASGLTFNLIKIIHVDGSVNFYADSDSDNDGQPDLLDPCPADPTNTCDTAGSAAGVIGTEGGTVATENSKAALTVPAGAIADPTSFSITDHGSGYEVAVYQGTMLVVNSYSIQPHGTAFNPPATITFHWGDADDNGIVDGTTLQESNLLLIKDGVVISPACAYNPSCDMVANTLTVQVSSLSLFELAAPVNRPPLLLTITAPLDPQEITTTIIASAAFLDPDLNDTHAAVWGWGDGMTSEGTVNESNWTVSGSHAYTKAGVYTVNVTLTDAAGAFNNILYQYVVVYDPDAGFVTGGGWINSPAGAYTTNPFLTGKATFGFVSRYQKGANVPTGNTEFQFKVANLNFSSTAYDWLVVAGAKAQYKGTGTINGTGLYRFMLTAIDGQISGGGGVDRFRIKIWDLVTGQVVYDNQFDAADDELPTAAIQGGSIVIHK